MLPSAKSGLYAIRDPCSESNPFSVGKLTVYCDMETDGGGWIVIQRRKASMGWVNFTRNRGDYVSGFGDLDGEFWIGLKNIYELTNQQSMQLQISVWNDTEATAKVIENYTYFRISRYYDLLPLHSDNENSSALPYSSNYHIGFSTFDRNYHYHHHNNHHNCAYSSQGGWWYFDCDRSNINGRHQPTDLLGVSPVRQRLVWRTGPDEYTVYTNSEMKIRPLTCGLS